MSNFDRDDERERGRRYALRNGYGGGTEHAGGTPGKQSPTGALPAGSNGPYRGSLFGAVQLKAAAAQPDGDVHSAAQAGVSGAGTTLPHLSAIQASFGRHDISHVRAHVGGAAAEATRAIGAHAYATGDQVAFGATPDLHLAAHEAAHVVQQRAGVHLAGGVGREGDPYEQHADAVADRVVRGESAEALLDQCAGGSSRSGVQMYRPHGSSGAAHARTGGRGGHGATGDHGTTGDHAADASTTQPGASGEPLHLIGRDGQYLVFDRPAFRHEVVAFLWGGALEPTQAELSGRGDIAHDPQAGELELGATHWMLARTAFAARPELLERMRPEARQMMETAPSVASREPARPAFVPQGVWQQFLAAGPGIHAYAGASALGTAIVLIRRDGQVSGYVEAVEDPVQLATQLHTAPASTLQRITRGETPEQAAARWLAAANRSYNAGMRTRVAGGADPFEARSSYIDDVNWAYLEAYVAAVGFMGSMAPTLASP